MIAYSKFSVRVAEFYFGEVRNGASADIVRHVQYPAPIEGVRCTPFSTILIDLNRPEADLFAEMDHTTRYEVRRGGDKDRLTAEEHLCPSIEILREFWMFCDRFAATKGLPKTNRRKLRALLDASALFLSCVRQEVGDPLVWHAYIRTNTCARLLHSASLFRSESDKPARQLAGRANRFLHWADILQFKLAGISTLDMGGCYEGTTDQERLRINAFKQGFGGQVVKTFNAEVAVTLKGELVLRGLSMMRRGHA